jgi:hypothetical protein
MRKTAIRLAGVALVLVLGAAACANDGRAGAVRTGPAHVPGSALGPAASLRVALDALLREHVYLAALATENALQRQTKAFDAAAAALDANSVALSEAVGSVYGADAQRAFLPLWRSHIGFVVDYTSNFGKEAAQQKAVTDLLDYTKDFGAFLAGANPNLTKEAVADLVKEHILTLKDVVDAQAAQDFAKAGTALREAAAHMGEIASALADAIVKQKPDMFGA